MNPHKESWQQQVGIVPKRSKNHLAKRLLTTRQRMFSGHSDKSKWERIGQPLFFDIPSSIVMIWFPYSSLLMRLGGMRHLYGTFQDAKK